MDTLALILSIVGSLNWGLVGIFDFDRSYGFRNGF